MSSTVEKIKDRLGVVEVVGNYLQLEKAGINYRARCPFHNEKTPSFFVSPTRGSWHCFGCNRGGDIISFVEEIEGVDFVGALKILAPLAGIELESYDKRESDERQRLIGALTAAAGYFAEQLSREPEVKKYLAGRGLKEETIKDFKIGFAPAAWRHVADYLTAKGYTEPELIKAGLLVAPATGAGAKGGRAYERFRSRIVFPLFDPAGRIVGFSGRIWQGREDEAKYINSPETLVYDKSRLLYGYDRAKVAIRSAGEAVLVEGQMDLVLSHQVGVTNAVAVSGTALTAEHLRSLKRLADNLVMSFDQDLAGINAARRAVDLALLLGFEVKAALLPPGQDPAEVVATAPEQFKAAIAGAKHIIDFYLAVLSAGGYSARELNRLVTKDVIPYVRRLNNALDQAHFVGKIAAFLNLAEEPVWAEVRKTGESVPVETPPTAATQPVVTREGKIERVLFSLLLWQEEKGGELAATLATELEQVVGEDFAKRRLLYQSLGEQLIFEAELAYEGAKNLAAEVKELVVEWRRERLRRELAETLALIKQAEAAGEQKLLDSYLKKCQDITQLLNNLTH